MLKREITYEDPETGEKVTDVYYFHLNQVEMIELETEHKEGLEATIRRIIETKDRKNLIAEFKNLVLLSYGVRSEDGKGFEKSDELRKKFSQTFAFPVLFMELATNDDAAATFIKGIVPREFAREMDKIQDVQLPAVKE